MVAPAGPPPITRTSHSLVTGEAELADKLCSGMCVLRWELSEPAATPSRRSGHYVERYRLQVGHFSRGFRHSTLIFARSNGPVARAPVWPHGQVGSRKRYSPPTVSVKTCTSVG